MGRRSTLELLRTLRRSDRERQGHAVAAAVRESEASAHAARVANAAHEAAGRRQRRAVDEEVTRVDSGQSTAGELMHSHTSRRLAEERLRELETEARRAEERARRAASEHSRASAAFVVADTAEARVRDVIAERAAHARALAEDRDEESAADHRNSNAASRRSRGGA